MDTATLSTGIGSAPARIHYPESDGKPLGETGVHVRAILGLLAGLELFLADREDVAVEANLFLYYEQGNPAAAVAPDVMVIKDSAKRRRRTFLAWEEGRLPSVVVEVTSKSTRAEDLGAKRALYERLGVVEYVLFDPLGEYLQPPLCAFVLARGVFQPAVMTESGEFASAELGCLLRPDAGLLRVVDAATGNVIPASQEANALAAELYSWATAPRDREDAQAARASAEAARADAEAARADAAAAEVARLREALRALRPHRD